MSSFKKTVAPGAGLCLLLLAGPVLAQDEAEAVVEEDVTELSDIEVVDDPLRALPNVESGSSFGFSKPILDTPRTVSFVSEEQINLLGISSVEDLTRAVPGTYTTTRYGLQGGINVRSVPADMYYRGMKRINMQGHARTVLSAMDNIEVVKGPPSPLYGMGKIGGYTNLDPKSSRAKTGSYLPESKGFFQVTQGSYRRTENQVGVGGPASFMDKNAGYYLFGLIEKSDTFVENVEVEQKFLQGTFSVENFAGPFRLETGGQMQNSVTSGGYMNRFTQELADSGRYVRGMPLVHLDTNGDGKVGYLETQQNSPVLGNLSASNEPLTQRFRWPTDANGNLLKIEDFPKVAGIPQTMLTYLNANPEADPTGLLRAQGAGGPLPISGQLPVGFVLDPRTVGVEKVNYRRNGAYEREQNADQYLGYIDMIYDVNPDFTMKNQLFLDRLDSFKDSWLPYGENQDIQVMEEKFTMTKRIPDQYLPDWLRVNSLGSVNYRLTQGEIISSGGDFDHRQDVMLNDGEHVPNTMFWTQLSNPDPLTGAVATTHRKSKFSETGIGIMFDIDIFTKTNLLLGARHDTSRAEARDLATFNRSAGTSADPGRPLTPQVERNKDSGKSWSLSLSHQLPYGLRPYVTVANSSLTLDTSNNTLQRNVVSDGHIGAAKLKEVGIKGSFLNDKLIVTTAAYEQSRTDVTTLDDPTAGAEVSSTEYKGVETEIKWVPTRDLYLSLYYLTQKGEYTIESGANVELTARQLGFQDVIDPATGAVIYPAEAFLYGGRASVVLPAGQKFYSDRTGDPETQWGFNGNYRMGEFGFLLGATYFSEVWADRVKTVELPDALVFNAGFTWDVEKWKLRLNGYNLTDELYFRARSSDTGAQLISVMPGRRWELAAKYEF